MRLYAKTVPKQLFLSRRRTGKFNIDVFLLFVSQSNSQTCGQSNLLLPANIHMW